MPQPALLDSASQRRLHLHLSSALPSTLLFLPILGTPLRVKVCFTPAAVLISLTSPQLVKLRPTPSRKHISPAPLPSTFLPLCRTTSTLQICPPLPDPLKATLVAVRVYAHHQDLASYLPRTRARTQGNFSLGGRGSKAGRLMRSTD